MMTQLGRFFFKYEYSFTTHAQRRPQRYTSWILRCEKDGYVFIGMGRGLYYAVISLCHDLLRNRDLFPELTKKQNMIRTMLEDHLGCALDDEFPEVDDGVDFKTLIESMDGGKLDEGQRAATWRDVRCLVPDTCRTRAKYVRKKNGTKTKKNN